MSIFAAVKHFSLTHIGLLKPWRLSKAIWLLALTFMLLVYQGGANANASNKASTYAPKDAPTDPPIDTNKSHDSALFWQTQQAIGQAQLSLLWWDIYDSWFYCLNKNKLQSNRHLNTHTITKDSLQPSLNTSQQQYDNQQQNKLAAEMKTLLESCHKIALKIRYKRDISQTELLAETQKQWQHLGITANTYDSWLNTLSAIWPDIKKQDELVFSLSKLKDKLDAQFYYQNQPLATIDNSQLALAFIAIWLSEHTSEPDLRKQLLNLKK